MLLEHKDWIQLKDIKYKSNNGRLSIITKEELRKLQIDSPDVADALMLTCVGGINTVSQQYNNKILQNKMVSQPRYI